MLLSVVIEKPGTFWPTGGAAGGVWPTLRRAPNKSTVAATNAVRYTEASCGLLGAKPLLD